MAIKDLKEAYKRTDGRYINNARELLNAAVRAELIGGNEALDALANADQLYAKLAAYSLPGTSDAHKAVNVLRDIADGMRAVIAKRYDLKSSRD